MADAEQALLASLTGLVMLVTFIAVLRHHTAFWRLWEKILENRLPTQRKARNTKPTDGLDEKLQKRMRERRLRAEARQRA
jgi:hypothetical protein